MSLSENCKKAVEIIYMDMNEARYGEAVQLLEQAVKANDSDAFYF